MTRQIRDDRPTKVTLSCPHYKHVHEGISEHGGYVDARWRAERAIEECGKRKAELEKTET